MNSLKNRTYRHSGYTSFYVTEPKLRRIEKSIYIDRIVHRWYVDNFMQEHFVKSFSYSSFACLKGKGMHNACLYVQEMMKHCKQKCKITLNKFEHILKTYRKTTI